MNNIDTVWDSSDLWPNPSDTCGVWLISQPQSSSITTRTTTAIEYRLTKTGDVLANKLLIAVLYWIVVTLIIAQIDKVSHLHTINLHLVGYIVQQKMKKMLKRQTAITISAIELTTCNLFQTYQLSVSLSDGWLGKWPRWKIVRKNFNRN